MDNTPEQKVEGEVGEQKSGGAKKWIIIAVVVVLGLGLLRTFFSPENLAERAIEQATNGQYDVDINRDGSMQVTGGEGESVNIATGGKATLPDGWPSSVPLVGDATIETSASVNDASGGMMNRMVTYQTADAVADVVAFYQQELVGNGWTVEATVNIGGSTMLSASNDADEGVVVNVSSADGGTTVVVSAQSKN